MEFLPGENLRQYLFSDRLWKDFLIAPSEQSSAAVTKKINCVVNKVFKSINAILDTFGEYSIDIHPGNIMVLMDEESGCPNIRQIDFQPTKSDPIQCRRIFRELYHFTNSIREQLLTIEIASRGGVVPEGFFDQVLLPPASLSSSLRSWKIPFHQYDAAIDINELKQIVDRYTISVDRIPEISTWGRLLGQGLHVSKDAVFELDERSIVLPDFSVSADAKPFTNYIESIVESKFNCLFVKILKLIVRENGVVPVFQLRDLVVSEQIPGECPEVFFKKTPRFSYLKPIDNLLARFNELLIEPGSI